MHHAFDRRLPPSTLLLTVLAVGPVLAQQNADEPAAAELAAVRVVGSAEKTKGSVTLDAKGLPAAVTVIGREDIERTNVGRDYTDLLRRVPGVNAYSFGQGDIGSPIKMRGFTGTGAHGGDVAIYVDGVPQNFPSANQGGPGMSDLSWLTPDMIERIEVIKGPFSALYGDQNRAGAINIVTRDRGESSIGLSAGSYGSGRGTAVLSSEHGAARSFVVADLYRTDGYRDNSGVARGNLFAKASLDTGDALWALRGSYYKSDWDAPGYLSFASLVNGTVKPSDRDPNAPPLFGDAERYGLVLTRRPARGEEGWHASAFAEHYEKRRANPAGGNPNGYNVQNDDRAVYGGRAQYHLGIGAKAAITAGAELRADRGTGINQRWDTPAGPGANVNNHWDLDLLTYGLFAQAQWQVLESFKLVGGVRRDAFDYRIDNLKLPAASVDYDASVTTPRAGFVWSPLKTLDVYANVGEGFRSPAERELSPPGPLGPVGAAGGTSFPDLKPPKVKARDVGFNARLGTQWTLSAAAYHTVNKSEIRETTPGSGVYAGIGDTTRNGWEVDARFDVTEAFSLYASYGNVKGRINTPVNAGQDLISGLPEHTYRLGGEYTAALAAGLLRANADVFQLSGAPYYVGASPVPLYSRIYTRYDLRVSLERNRVRYAVYGVFQPHAFAGEQAGATVDPRPRADVGVALTYTF